MKRTCNKKIRIMAMMLALAMIVQIFAPSLTARAADGDPYVYDTSGVFEPKTKTKNQILWMWIENFPENGQVKNLKSSNTKIGKVSWTKSDPDYIQITPKKAGKITVSFDLVYGGTTKSMKAKATIAKYQKPCASFKVGNKNYNSKYKGTSYNRIKYTGTKKYKISVKAAKGWKLKEIYYGNNKMKKDKKIKNNTTVKCSNRKNSYTLVYAIFQNKKTKNYQTLYFGLERK